MTGFHAQSGVVLRRKISPEGDITMDLFLKELGRTQAVAKGAGRGSVRFGGATEPLTWGNFGLYKSAKSGRMVLRSIDAKHDAVKLRGEILLTAARWVRLLLRYIEEGRADDKLLSCFYWSITLLEEGVPTALAEFRFVWRWLNIWGIAPALDDETLRFAACVPHEAIKNVREIGYSENEKLFRARTERLVLIFDSMT